MPTFAIIGTDANESAGRIHDRRPLIVLQLSAELDPRDLLRPFGPKQVPMVAAFDAGQQAGKG
jgi:putative SOS response-associated peptidase YedK